MSASAPSVPPAAREPKRRSFWIRAEPGDLVVFHHSPLFYWWPVWLFGFVLSALTYLENHHMAIVPAGTEALEARPVLLADDDDEVAVRDVLVLPENRKLLTHRTLAGDVEIDQTPIYISHQKWTGTAFVAVLLLVIAITNVPMRGLWSLLVMVILSALVVILSVAGLWGGILSRLGLLATHINLSGYILLSTVLFALWVFNFVLMDRQTYVIFSPGQVRVRLEVGGGETVYDTAGMVVQKQRSDLFRHWVLGFGSGDLLVRPAGVAHPIEMPNVLHVGRVVRRIEEMVKEKAVFTQ